MPWPRDDAKLERVRSLMADAGLDAIVARAPDNVLYLTNFWGMKGWDAVVFPARRRADPLLRRGLGGRRGADGLDDATCASSTGYLADDPRPPVVRTLELAADARPRARDGRARALARDAGVRPHGRRADDVHEGLVRRVSRRRRRDAAARRGAGEEDRRRRSSGCGSRTRSRPRRWTTSAA